MSKQNIRAFLFEFYFRHNDEREHRYKSTNQINKRCSQKVPPFIGVLNKEMYHWKKQNITTFLLLQFFYTFYTCLQINNTHTSQCSIVEQQISRELQFHFRLEPATIQVKLHKKTQKSIGARSGLYGECCNLSYHKKVYVQEFSQRGGPERCLDEILSYRCRHTQRMREVSPHNLKVFYLTTTIKIFFIHLFVCFRVYSWLIDWLTD